jgi:hypothetical protein
LHRGDWRAPSKINARRCERCSSLAQGLSIPALTERAGGIRSGEFTGAHLPALGKRAVALLARAPSYEHVHASINKVAYAIILERLVAVVSADPVPIVMATLDVTERKSLVRFAQADLHARLQTLDWQQILEGAIPHTRPTDECNHLILRAHLEKATRDLPY